MEPARVKALRRFCQRFSEHPAARAIEAGDAAPGPGNLVARYETAIRAVEQRLWETRDFGETLELYQALFRELEGHPLVRGRADRHDFVVVVPVADRPRHLEACLESLLTLCRNYHYGGLENGRFPRVSVLVADDSRDGANRARHREIAASIERRGLETRYLGPKEQAGLAAALEGVPGLRPAALLGALAGGDLFHKGPSATRNAAYLALNRLRQRRRNPLFYFVDSDQTFEINAVTDAGERAICGINYLYELDRLFATPGTRVVTGKVVGDPPVSPAVMTARFLDDVIAFLDRLTTEDPGAPCRFHDTQESAGDAAYHDMADLFGFAAPPRAFGYRCDLAGPHDHAACLDRFSDRLAGFFDGEHPTRRSRYEYRPVASTLTPARTVYTGNYVIDPEGLRYFVPFPALRLRMAGPALGRLIRAEIGAGFLSANLPMLHGRTVDGLGRSEFRPGVRREAGTVDLSGEFERQYFGDVVLFSVERLVGAGFPGRAPERAAIATTVAKVERNLRDRYLDRQAAVLDRLEQLRERMTLCDPWWRGYGDAFDRLQRFAGNLARNFEPGAPGYRLTGDGPHKRRRLAEIVDALAGLPGDRRAWERALERDGGA